MSAAVALINSAVAAVEHPAATGSVKILGWVAAVLLLCGADDDCMGQEAQPRRVLAGSSCEVEQQTLVAGLQRLTKFGREGTKVTPGRGQNGEGGRPDLGDSHSHLLASIFQEIHGGERTNRRSSSHPADHHSVGLHCPCTA